MYMQENPRRRGEIFESPGRKDEPKCQETGGRAKRTKPHHTSAQLDQKNGDQLKWKTHRKFFSAAGSPGAIYVGRAVPVYEDGDFPAFAVKTGGDVHPAAHGHLLR